MSDEQETREAWAVLVNTDLTEGRGRQYVKHICDLEATAVRLAKGSDVQGTNGTVMRVTLQKRGGAWLGPVETDKPTEQDKRTQVALEAQRDVEEKARSLGLTDEDIEAIRRRV